MIEQKIFRNQRLWVTLIALLAFFYASNAFAYKIINNGNTYSLDPIVADQTPEDYYSYNDPQRSSGVPPFGPEANTGFFWLYRQSSSDLLQLGVIFNKDGEGDSNRMEMKFFNADGLPSSAHNVYVSDESDELRYYVDGYFKGAWYWMKSYTDGGVIGDFDATPAQPWEIHVAVGRGAATEYQWYFLSSDYSQGDNKYARPLTFTNDGGLTEIQLRISSSDVPAPAAVWLLGSGLLGLTGLRRKFRK